MANYVIYLYKCKWYNETQEVKCMQIINLDKEEVAKAAAIEFSGKYIEMESCDLFLKDEESGKASIDFIDHEVYIGTNYVYEDRLVNGNKTRYKVPITIIYLKKDPYETIYDSKGKCYVAYKEDTIHFILYEDFYTFIKPQIHMLEE